MDAFHHSWGRVGGVRVFAPMRQHSTENQQRDPNAREDKQKAQKLSHGGFSVRDGSGKYSGVKRRLR